MRTLIAGLAATLAIFAISPAMAQDYPWCAVYDHGGAVTNCGFVSLEQCRWTVSGAGGYCREKTF